MDDRSRQSHQNINHLWVQILLSLFIFCLAYIPVSYRLSQVPDIFTDEIIYTRVSIRVAGEGALVWDSGEPFLIHPPLYFLVNAANLYLTGNANTPIYGTGDILDSVFDSRLLNAFIAGLTAVVLYWFGVQLHSSQLGLLVAGLFLLDPFGLRINRRAMLETLAVFLSLTGMLVFLSEIIHQDKRIRAYLFSPRILVSGFLFGAALLAKELSFISLVVLMLFSLVELSYHLLGILRLPNGFKLHELSRLVLPVGLVVLIAGLTYAIYPIWVLTSGEWDPYFAEKLLGVKRLLGLVQLTGWNRPGISFTSLLLQRLTDYGTSYLILAMGGVSTLSIALWSRGSRSGRLMFAWGAFMYPFFAFVALTGSGNDQFFYYLLIPAILLVGFAGATLSQAIERLPRVAKKLAMAHGFLRMGSWVLGLLTLQAVFGYNMWMWYTNYFTGADNGYTQFVRFVEQNIPPGEPVNASGDPVKFRYMFPNRPTVAAATPEEAMLSGIHYFALVPKDVQFRYGLIQPELAAWIQTQGTPLFSFTGESYGSIFLYRVDHPVENIQVENNVSSKIEGDSHWRSFKPASGGYVASLSTWLLLWALLCTGLAVAPSLMRPAVAGSKRVVSYQWTDALKGLASHPAQRPPVRSTSDKLGNQP